MNLLVKPIEINRDLGKTRRQEYVSNKGTKQNQRRTKVSGNKQST